ncbi:MAG: cupin domain-containing protein [Bryobacterales bacterium]|nr:cupin domain-containing protein [Bryobacterales bacterium]
MSEKYVLVEDLREHTTVPERGILSTTLQTDDRSKIIQFVFAPGQELSAHTAPVPAILYFAKGEADLTLGDEQKQAAEGTLVHMAAQLPHGIKAKTEVVMLLIMLKG